MSKERARRREAREQAAATRAAARDASERRTARRRALVDPVAGPVRRARLALSTGQQSGSLAHKRRTRLRLIICALVFVQLIVWIVRPDWEARFAALVIAALAFPVIAAFTL